VDEEVEVDAERLLSDARLQGVRVSAIDNLDRPPKARLEKDRQLVVGSRRRPRHDVRRHRTA